MLSSRPLGITFDGDYRNFAKTPGRTVLKSRTALQENVGHRVHAPSTVAGKAKKAAVQHTLFHPNTLQSQKNQNDHDGIAKSKGKALLARSRPLGDKTPFPNRINHHLTPLPVVKTVSDVTPGALFRPSSARKHVRLPRSASKSFQTPVTGGNHWDVSDIDINPEVTAASNKLIEEDDYDEIEYMPPKLPELPYEPPFELPNYKEVGKTLLDLVHSYSIEDVPPHVMLGEFTTPGSDDKFFAPAGLSLPHLVDDSPFAQVAPNHEPRVVPAPPSSKNITRPLRSGRGASTVEPTLAAVPRSSIMRPRPMTNATTSKSVTRPASSATIQRGPPSRVPSTRAPSTTTSRVIAAIPRTRLASVSSTSTRPPTGTTTRKVGVQSRASAKGMLMKNAVHGVEILFKDSWQEEEFKFSV